MYKSFFIFSLLRIKSLRQLILDKEEHMKRHQIPLDELNAKNNLDETEIRIKPAKSDTSVH